jgi:hypothetical protein
MNDKMIQIGLDSGMLNYVDNETPRHYFLSGHADEQDLQKFAELIVRECVNREELLGAIARGWCSEKNAHKTMDSDLALAIFDEVEKQIREYFGVK